MRIIRCLLVFLIFTGIAFAEDTADKQKVYTATVDKDGVQRVEIVGGGYYFDPSYIIVKKDVPVELTVIKTSGFIPHNIVIESPEAGINHWVQTLKSYVLPLQKPASILFSVTKNSYFFRATGKRAWKELLKS